MGCACGQSVRGRQAIQTAQASGSGLYPLYTFQGCTELHSTGPYAGRSIYIVARGTDQERLFRRDQLAGAAAYARSIKSSNLENAPTAALCDAAVLAVYAGG